MAKTAPNPRMILLAALAPLLISGGRLQGPVQLPTQGPQSQIGPFPDRGERCPGHGADAISPLSLSGEQTNIPEFNDCQRFIVTNSRQERVYGALYAIFASVAIKEALTELKQLECRPSVQVTRVPGSIPAQPSTEVGGPGSLGGQTGPLAVGNPLQGGVRVAASVRRTVRAVVGPITLREAATANLAVAEPNFVADTDCRARDNTDYNGVAVPVAEIVSWGGWYGPLGIKPNYNCLYIYDSAALKALMVPVGMEETRCRQVVDPYSVPGTQLHVTATKRHGLSAQDVPAVARWDRRPGRSGITYIGMACGDDMWCEVGPKPGALGVGQAFSQQYASTDASAKKRRVVEVKGWYDEQELAILDLSGRAKPSGVVGTLVPDPRLDDYTDDDFSPGSWLPAATIYIRGLLEKYRHSMNLDATMQDPPATTVNRGYLCKGHLKQCIPDVRQWTYLKPACLDHDRVYYYSKIESAKGQVMYRCVSYYHHEIQRKIPGIVRWAWFDTDEGEWWRCPSGCCFPE